MEAQQWTLGVSARDGKRTFGYLTLEALRCHRPKLNRPRFQTPVTPTNSHIQLEGTLSARPWNRSQRSTAQEVVTKAIMLAHTLSESRRSLFITRT